MRNSRSCSSTPRDRSLGREIAWALVFKMIALAVIYFAFFGSAHQTPISADQIAAALGEPAPNPGKH